MVPSCAEGGVLGVLCASIGSIQVNEAIKLIAGIGEPLAGRLMIYDALEMSYRTVRVQKDPECAVCGKNPTVTELIDYDAFCGAVSDEAAEAVVGSTITATDLKGMLDREEKIFLVDVREPQERRAQRRVPGDREERRLLGRRARWRRRAGLGQAGRPEPPVVLRRIAQPPRLPRTWMPVLPGVRTWRGGQAGV